MGIVRLMVLHSAGHGVTYLQRHEARALAASLIQASRTIPREA
jgi:hypothetical protein